MNELRAYPSVLTAAAAILEQHDSLRDLTIQVQQIPSPTGQEEACAKWVADYFRRIQLEDVEIDSLFNVYGRIPGHQRTPALMLSAHTDTVFHDKTDLVVRVDAANGMIYGPSIGDNSAGVAGLLKTAETLNTLESPPVDIWIVANSREEGTGDLLGMRAVIDRLLSDLGACIVIEGMGLTRIVHRGLASQRFRVTVAATGGHSWSDFGNPSAIHVLAQIAADVSRIKPPRHPRTTFNIGTIKGGRSVNTIAQDAFFELDLRSEDSGTLTNLVSQVKSIISTYQSTHQANREISIDVCLIGDRPSGQIEASHPLVTAAVDALRQTGFARHSLRISSTDANIPLSRGIPAICVGITKGEGAHRLQERIDSTLIPYGVKHITLLAWRSALWLASMPPR